MDNNREHSLKLEGDELPFLKRNLADFLTLSRGVTGLTILALGLAGKHAYILVLFLILLGTITDILDGRAARHYLGENREGRLGKYDAEIDTFFLICIFAYMTFADIITLKLLGFGWIGLVIIAAIVSNRSMKVLVAAEIISVITLLLVALLYNPAVFWSLIVPAMAVLLFLNRRRVLFLIFDYWPRLFSR